MKKFLTRVLLFGLVLLVINTVFYFAGWNLYFKDYTDPKLNYNSFLLSDSHGETLKDFAEKYGVYNFSNSGDAYLDMERKVKFLLRHAKMDTLYLTADDHMLAPYRATTNNMDKSVKYSLPGEFDSYWEYFKNKYFRRYVVLFAPKVRTILRLYISTKFRSMMSGKPMEAPDPDWKLMTTDERMKSSRKRATMQFSADTLSTILQRSLSNILAVCKEKNVTVIGVKFPLTPEFLETLHGKTYEADKVFEQAGLTIMDFTHVYADRDDYFLNQDHLNRKGSLEFVDLMFSDKKQAD